jgi:hypothetical protein
VWRFTEPETGGVYGRSEGIAVASLYMFTSGALGSDSNGSHENVDGENVKCAPVVVLCLLTLSYYVTRSRIDCFERGNVQAKLPDIRGEPDCRLRLSRWTSEKRGRIAPEVADNFRRDWPARAPRW